MKIPVRTVKTVSRAAAILVALFGLGTFGVFMARGDLRSPREARNERADLGWSETTSAELLYKPTETIALTPVDLRGLALDGEGRIYVCSERLLVLGADRELQLDIPLSETAGCIAVDPGEGGGHPVVYLGMTDHVEVHDRHGCQIAVWTDLGEKALITALAVSGESVYAADAGNRAVLRFSKGGRLLNRFQGADAVGFIVPSPYFDLAVERFPGREERLWVANPGRHRLECYRPDGERLGFWGRGSIAVEDFPGCCNPVHFALLDSGRFVTGEKGIPRVKLYERDGGFLGLVADAKILNPRSANIDIAVDGSDNIYVLDPGARLIRVFAPEAEEG